MNHFFSFTIISLTLMKQGGIQTHTHTHTHLTSKASKKKSPDW